MGALCNKAEKEPKAANQTNGTGDSKPKAAANGEAPKSKPVKAKYLMKLGMIGTSSCGKTTVAKQMRILHCNGFTDEEKENYKKILISNVLVAFKELVKQSKNMGVAIEHEEAGQVLTTTDPFSSALTPELVNHIKDLWQDDGIKTVYERRNEFDIPSNTEYCVNMIDNLANPEFQITQDDILRARQRTTGITENEFQVGKFTWNLVDPGGQRAERRKWPHFFQNIVGMIFIAALDEWDVILPEDPKKTRLQESLEVFESMVNHELFAMSPWILFLNKKDIFQEKIKTTELSKTFPEYKGGADYNKGVEFIKGLYTAQIKNRNPNDVYSHVTCALDTEQVKVVFGSVTDFVFQKSAEQGGVF